MQYSSNVCLGPFSRGCTEMSDGMPAQENVKEVPAVTILVLVMASAVFAYGNAFS